MGRNGFDGTEVRHGCEGEKIDKKEYYMFDSMKGAGYAMLECSRHVVVLLGGDWTERRRKKRRGCMWRRLASGSEPIGWN